MMDSFYLSKSLIFFSALNVRKSHKNLNKIIIVLNNFPSFCNNFRNYLYPETLKVQWKRMSTIVTIPKLIFEVLPRNNFFPEKLLPSKIETWNECIRIQFWTNSDWIKKSIRKIYSLNRKNIRLFEKGQKSK